MLFQVSFASAPAAIRAHFVGLNGLKCMAKEERGNYVMYVVHHAGEKTEFKFIDGKWKLTRKF